MIKHTIQYRIIYADTDAMGVMYYANYLRVYEAARGDFMRKIGFSFSEMEKRGIVCPAINVNLEYFRFAKFDNEVTIITSVEKIPASKLEFIQEMYDTDNKIINRAIVTLGFVNSERFKAVRCPDWIVSLFKNQSEN
ncbi:MAG TPA: thioesterase family protein [Bacteroidales bacterium]|nr:thioesterase family protein [Bacteroidales bacterium]